MIEDSFYHTLMLFIVLDSQKTLSFETSEHNYLFDFPSTSLAEGCVPSESSSFIYWLTMGGVYILFKQKNLSLSQTLPYIAVRSISDVLPIYGFETYLFGSWFNYNR